MELVFQEANGAVRRDKKGEKKGDIPSSIRKRAVEDCL